MIVLLGKLFIWAISNCLEIIGFHFTLMLYLNDNFYSSIVNDYLNIYDIIAKDYHIDMAYFEKYS